MYKFLKSQKQCSDSVELNRMIFADFNAVKIIFDFKFSVLEFSVMEVAMAITFAIFILRYIKIFIIFGQFLKES